MLVMNATNEKISVKALGNWFEFKPKQVKNMEQKIGHFLITERRENGLVALPDSFEDPEYKNSPEGKAELATIEQRGIEAFCDSLRKRIYNNQVSLRMDLERANIKADPSAFVTEGELEAMRLLAKYQTAKDDSAQKKQDEVKELMKKIGPGAGK
jgi:hypothetical protein